MIYILIINSLMGNKIEYSQEISFVKPIINGTIIILILILIMALYLLKDLGGKKD